MTTMEFKSINSCHTLIAVILACSIASFTQTASKPDEVDQIKESVITAIEHNYLNAHANPLWNIARDKILHGKYQNKTEAYKDIQMQLPILEDSELNLLTPDEIKATQSEALGEQIGIGLPDFALDLGVNSGEARVVTPVVGSPAMNAQIEPGDIIVSINGKRTNDMIREQVVDALRASPTVHLQLRRNEKHG
jgi:carboxyl-terminal processing protease